MKRIIDFIKLTLLRLFIHPCYRCVREGKCALYDRRGFCGDWGLCYYEEGEQK